MNRAYDGRSPGSRSPAALQWQGGQPNRQPQPRSAAVRPRPTCYGDFREADEACEPCEWQTKRDCRLETLAGLPEARGCVRFGEYDPEAKHCRTCNRRERPECIDETNRIARRAAGAMPKSPQPAAAAVPSFDSRKALLALMDSESVRRFGVGLQALDIVRRLQIPYCTAFFERGFGSRAECSECQHVAACKRRAQSGEGETGDDAGSTAVL